MSSMRPPKRIARMIFLYSNSASGGHREGGGLHGQALIEPLPMFFSCSMGYSLINFLKALYDLPLKYKYLHKLNKKDSMLRLSLCSTKKAGSSKAVSSPSAEEDSESKILNAS